MVTEDYVRSLLPPERAAGGRAIMRVLDRKVRLRLPVRADVRRQLVL